MTIDTLFVDCYQGDGPKDWDALAAAGSPWCGVRLKATEGLYDRPPWFAQQLAAVVKAGADRAGVDWFFGSYHYLNMSQDGAAQADYFLKALGDAVTGAGLSGWSPAGLLWPMVDVERSGQRAPMLTRHRVEDVTTSFAARILAVTGRTPTLYGGELLNSLGITSHLGCSRLLIARYTPTLPHEVITRIGWTSPDEWQYCGDGVGHLAGYPTTAPGCGKIDISVLTAPGGLPALRAALAA